MDFLCQKWILLLANSDNRLDRDSFFGVFECFVDLFEIIYFNQFIEREQTSFIIVHQLGNEHLRNGVAFNHTHYRFAFCHDVIVDIEGDFRCHADDGA